MNSSSASRTLLEARDLSRCSPDGSSLLASVSFAILTGDRIVCSGDSGSGKTVLLRALALLDQTDGDVLWKGESVENRRIPFYRSRVIYVAQRSQLPEGTVREALHAPFLWKANESQSYNESLVIELLESLGRPPVFLDAETDDLSGGESQIVALIRALQLGPEILLFDEPTSALDDKTTLEVEKLTSKWHEQGERAYLWVTHNHQQAKRIANRRFQLASGRLTIDG